MPDADPLFAQLAQFAGLLELPWDMALAEFNARAAAVLPGDLCFVEQDQSLLDDGLSYEQRIGERRQIAMRRDSLHDLYGALMWLHILYILFNHFYDRDDRRKDNQDAD